MDREIRSIEHVCEVALLAGAGDTDDAAAPGLLIEVPHGATLARHFDAVQQLLVDPLPEELREFFFVNTDVGAPECALALGRRVADPASDPELVARLERAGAPAAAAGGHRTLVVRSLIPRTFIDCNRVVEVSGEEFRRAGFTPAIPPYVAHEADRRTLERLYRAYQDVVDRAFARVCGAGGQALLLHTYAPKSVRVEVDENIVAALRRAYRPELYETWETRPEIDVIRRTADDLDLAPARLGDRVRSVLERVGFEVADSATYRLHPSTTGHRHSAAYPGRVLCVEVRRDLLADPFEPFREMRIGADRVDRVARALAEAWLLEEP